MASVSRDGMGGSSALLRALVGVLAGAAVACGDTLVDETYSGTPRFTVRGKMLGNSDNVSADQLVVDLAVFWFPQGPGRSDVLVQQPGTLRHAEYFRPFDMNLFDEPGAEHLFTMRSGARYGIARIGAYQDANRNGRKDASEPFVGYSHKKVLIRAPGDLLAEDSPTGAPLKAGWHIVSTPLSCPASVRPPGSGGPTPGPVPVPDGECGVPLGAACRNDGDCGGGVCVHEYAGPWNEGACLIPAPPPNGCLQRGSVLLRDPEFPDQAYWIPACQSTADCGRAHPYQCDQQVRGCMPTAEVSVELDDAQQPPPICAGGGAPKQ
jgi:hypothetical protein